MDTIKLTRKELYDLVWAESLTALARRLNIQYSYLRIICNDMNVPVPPNGHWTKLKFGKPVNVIELPLEYDGVPEVSISKVEAANKRTDSPMTIKKSPIECTNKDENLILSVPKKLINPDPLILAAQKMLNEYRYNKYNDHGMVRAEGTLNIRVSRNNIGRALRFMDTLIKLLKSRGHSIQGKYTGSILIDNEHFEFKLNEKTNRISAETKWVSSRYESTGLLYFEIGGYMGRSWIDGKILIEERLSNILLKIESTIDLNKEERLKIEEHYRKLREEERIIREQEERIEKERSDFKNLYEQAKRWERARLMRNYISAVQTDAIAKNGLTEELQNWLKWARENVDLYDPLINRTDDILGFASDVED